MKITRRNFLLAAPLAAGAVLNLKGTAFGNVFAVPSRAADDALARLNWDSFLPYVNTDFAFTDASGRAVTLGLADIVEYTTPRSKSAGEKLCFTLVFRGPARRQLPEGTYTVDHFALGKFDLFIGPGAANGKQQAYRAVINRTAQVK